MKPFIPLIKPYLTGQELQYICQLEIGHKLSGDGIFTKDCEKWLEEKTTCLKALLTHSCTAALEMAAILIDTQPGDEIIMPSYTFVSTANAFVLRGGVPVFVDIREDTLNIDETKIEAAITHKTKAIVAVHYAGVACEMDSIMAIAKKYNLFVIEDAAQAIMSSYKNKSLGSIGHIGTFSFHDTKNIISGEGGALLINDPTLIERAEIIREKGTNRKQFFQGQVDKYTWVDIGSSYLPSELTAAFLLAQFDAADKITKTRLNLWNKYHQYFEVDERQQFLRRPVLPEDCQHNGHLYYLLMPTAESCSQLICYMQERNIHATFHYIPLHSSPAGRQYAKTYHELTVTNDLAFRIVRLPLWINMNDALDVVVNHVKEFLSANNLADRISAC